MKEILLLCIVGALVGNLIADIRAERRLFDHITMECKR